MNPAHQRLPTLLQPPAPRPRTHLQQRVLNLITIASLIQLRAAGNRQQRSTLIAHPCVLDHSHPQMQLQANGPACTSSAHGLQSVSSHLDHQELAVLQELLERILGLGAVGAVGLGENHHLPHVAPTWGKGMRLVGTAAATMHPRSMMLVAAIQPPERSGLCRHWRPPCCPPRCSAQTPSSTWLLGAIACE